MMLEILHVAQRDLKFQAKIYNGYSFYFTAEILSIVDLKPDIKDLSRHTQRRATAPQDGLNLCYICHANMRESVSPGGVPSLASLVKSASRCDMEEDICATWPDLKNSFLFFLQPAMKADGLDLKDEEGQRHSTLSLTSATQTQGRADPAARHLLSSPSQKWS